jgi:hypothetical protein
MDDAQLARFDRVASRMPAIATAVSGFDDTMRDKAFYALMGILDPDGELDNGDHTVFTDLAEVRRDKQVLSDQIVKLGEFLTARYPGAVRPGPVVDMAIQLLTERWAGPSGTSEAAAARIELLSSWLADNTEFWDLHGGEDAVDCAIRLLADRRRDPKTLPSHLGGL